MLVKLCVEDTDVEPLTKKSLVTKRENKQKWDEDEA